MWSNLYRASIFLPTKRVRHLKRQETKPKKKNWTIFMVNCLFFFFGGRAMRMSKVNTFTACLQTKIIFMWKFERSLQFVIYYLRSSSTSLILQNLVFVFFLFLSFHFMCNKTKKLWIRNRLVPNQFSSTQWEIIILCLRFHIRRHNDLAFGFIALEHLWSHDIIRRNEQRINEERK